MIRGVTLLAPWDVSVWYVGHLLEVLIELSLYAGVITLPVLVVAGGLALWDQARGGLDWKRAVAIIVTPGTIPVLLLIFAVVFADWQSLGLPDGHATPSTDRDLASLDDLQSIHAYLGLLFLPITALTFLIAHRHWRTAFASVLMWAWCGILASSVAGMSISGFWL